MYEYILFIHCFFCIVRWLLLFVAYCLSRRIIIYLLTSLYGHVINSPALRKSAKSNKAKLSTEEPSVRGGVKGGSYDTRKFIELIQNQCPSYSVITAKLRGEMRLVVLALKDLEEEITNVYIAGENTGIGGIMANKVCFH